MKLYGLIGYPLHHSFSQAYFTEKFEKENISGHKYLNFPIKNIEEVSDIIKSFPDLKGLNVTIPYKEKIISFLNEISSDAQLIGAVNTVRIMRKDKKIRLAGYNTDIYGFKKSLLSVIHKDIKNAMILGSGGSSKAIKYVLEELGINYVVVSRKEKDGYLKYSDIDKKIMETYRLIINTTPLGTFPEINSAPDIPYDYISRSHILYDLVYNPSETKFLLEGKKRSATIKNGLEMLYGQAEESWRIWNDPDAFSTVLLR